MNQYLEVLKRFDLKNPVSNLNEEGIAENKNENDSPQSKLLMLAYQINKEFNFVGKIETGSYCQDCSHVGEIELLVGTDTGVWPVNIRPSYFGNFITILDEKNALKSKKIEADLIEIFGELNYRYIPYEVLTAPYSGKGNYETWFHRYFDYE